MGSVSITMGAPKGEEPAVAVADAEPLSAEDTEKLEEIDVADLPDWQDLFTEDELKASIKVLKAFHENNKLKDWAQCDVTFREFFHHGVAVFAPSKKERREQKKNREKKKRWEDQQLLATSGIRVKKQQAMDQYMYALTPAADALMLTSLTREEEEEEDEEKKKLAAEEERKIEEVHKDDDDEENQGQQEEKKVVAQESEHVAEQPDVEVTAENADQTESMESPAAAATTSGDNTDGVRQDTPEPSETPSTLRSGTPMSEGKYEHIADAAPAGKSRGQLKYARKCCNCGVPYKDLHHFYDKMCMTCGDFNYSKRGTTADLTGRVALVTGGRVKIGFAVALKLLRLGARTIVTTRFPNDAALRFASQPDFLEWKDRVHVYGIDFRDIPALHRFVAYLKQTYDRLDIIINNAAQTVRKPPSFYRHLMANEARPLPQAICDVVPQFNHQERAIHRAISGADHVDMEATPASLSSTVTCPAPTDYPVGSAHRSAALSQVPLIVGDESHNTELFPEGMLDVDLQQVDLRTDNSWTQTLEEINSVELVECHAINAFAPFIINSELKPLMDRVPDADKYIVNVSAMEGQFYRKNKTSKHPHTNMAKASLNMMTRTAAADYARSNIYMTCVDTGWITDENPVHLHEARTDPPPLDDVDAAMRILDPVLTGVNDPAARVYGVFLKDYKPTRW